MARKKASFEDLAVQFAMGEDEAKVRTVVATMYAILNQRFPAVQKRVRNGSSEKKIACRHKHIGEDGICTDCGAKAAISLPSIEYSAKGLR